MKKNIKDLKILINSEELKEKIKEVANEINLFYKNDEILNIVCVLKGAVMFFTELSKHLKMPVRMEFVSLSSYGNSEKSSGVVKSNNLNLPEFENENVLVVEDMLDTGLTMDFFIKYIKENCNAKDVRLAVMFCKKCARKYNVKPDFFAFDIDEKFVVGFGLDYCNLYRNLDYVGYFE